ncbi:hypothetical protein ABW20_dc0105833 [Dactylellina cionopaga]|nr:hypothetical protein ABW20_dc0105833 [Dactylellina cionopaga]
MDEIELDYLDPELPAEMEKEKPGSNAETNAVLNPTQLAQDITLLKRFCLTISEEQDNLATRVEQLKQPSSSSSDKLVDKKGKKKQEQPPDEDMQALKSRLTGIEESLQTVIKNQNKLMAQMKLHSKRSYSDFAVEIPVITRNRTSPSPGSAVQQQQQQQNVSPPPSIISERIDDSTISTATTAEEAGVGKNSKPAEKKLKPKSKLKQKTQPREADSAKETRTEAGSADIQEPLAVPIDKPIVISDDGDDDDDDPEYSEKGTTGAHTSKRARLSKGKDTSKKGKVGGSGRASTGSVGTQELRVGGAGADDTTREKGRDSLTGKPKAARSKKST